ncbi:hypothetical protein PsorP6_009662 [Peronosclerospora sorghi]|uniref:Uncharacterized protein n=1 Tax=Peronosclerospora sorghi TaxID=230839 RepID=A0ACC0VX90_9STRA|nr:hypothetical protein PsorP6_009662 [Peronosclerospora sorghi]
MANPLVKKSSMPDENNHVYLNILPQAIVDPQYLEGVIRILAYRYAERLEQLGVTTVELKIIARFIARHLQFLCALLLKTLPAYVEAAGHNEPIFTSIGDEHMVNLTVCQSQHNTRWFFPFIRSVRWPGLLEYNLLRQWRKYVQQRTRGGSSKNTIPNLIMETRELILDATGKALTDFWWSFYWDLRFNNEGGRSMKQLFRHKMVVNQS